MFVWISDLGVVFIRLDPEIFHEAIGASASGGSRLQLRQVFDR